MAIDLPLKALVWQDEAGRTWLAYNDPEWLARAPWRRSTTEHSLDAMTDALAAVAKEATEA